MPTIDTTGGWEMLDNPERITLRNPDNQEVTIDYGFRRMSRLVFIDEGGLQRTGQTQRWLAWAAHLGHFKPVPNCRITDAEGKHYYTDDVTYQGNGAISHSKQPRRPGRTSRRRMIHNERLL